MVLFLNNDSSLAHCEYPVSLLDLFPRIHLFQGQTKIGNSAFSDGQRI